MNYEQSWIIPMSPETESKLWECRCRIEQNVRDAANAIHELNASRFLPTLASTPYSVQFHFHISLLR
jgi:hypothetical protein